VKILNNGWFSFNIETDELAKGLRPSKRNPRNSKYLTKCVGAVGLDNVLQVLDELSRLDTSAEATTFPYPQLFILNNHIIICTQTKIYEWVSNALELKITVDAGSIWSVVDFYDYLYFSNSMVSVVRNTDNGDYVLSDLPISSAICNYNGQVIIGSPGEFT